MSTTVTRRSVVALAWAAPVLALAVAAPAAAASNAADEATTTAPGGPAGTNSVLKAGLPFSDSITAVASHTFAGTLFQTDGTAPSRMLIALSGTTVGVTAPTSVELIKQTMVPPGQNPTGSSFTFVAPVSYTRMSAAYTFRITVIPDNDPMTVFSAATSPNYWDLTIVAATNGGGFTPPPPITPTTPTPTPTAPGVDCQVHRSATPTAFCN